MIKLRGRHVHSALQPLWNGRLHVIRVGVEALVTENHFIKLYRSGITWRLKGLPIT